MTEIAFSTCDKMEECNFAGESNIFLLHRNLRNIDLTGKEAFSTEQYVFGGTSVERLGYT